MRFQPVYDAIRESFTNDPWYVYAEPKDADGDMKVIDDKLQDLIKNSDAKIILSESDEEFEQNYADFQNQIKADRRRRARGLHGAPSAGGHEALRCGMSRGGGQDAKDIFGHGSRRHEAPDPAS